MYKYFCAFSLCFFSLSVFSSQSDIDNDGIPNIAETAPLNPNDQYDAQEDFDSDGWSNLDEYRAGTDFLDHWSNPNTVAHVHQKVFPSEQNSNEYFGFATAIHKDTALIGKWSAGSDHGAYLYARVNGIWQEQYQFAFGEKVFSVGLTDTVAVVGNPASSSVNVFEQPAFMPGVWVSTQILQQSGGFGFRLAIEGNTLVVSAPGQRQVYVYTRMGELAPWVIQQVIQSPVPSYASFARDVSLSGDTIIVGAPYDSTMGQNVGAVFVYTYRNGIWQLTQKLSVQGSSTTVGGEFGNSVSISGDLALIGAYHSSDSVNSGAAYIFQRVNGFWLLQQKLNPSTEASEYTFFGAQLALENNKVLVGAQSYLSLDSGVDCGAVFLFEEQDGIWQHTQTFTAEDRHSGDFFGEDIAISEDTALIGARWHNEGLIRGGAAYFFNLSPSVH